jgi:hypothetical protein
LCIVDADDRRIFGEQVMMRYRTVVSPRDALRFQRSVKFDIRVKDGGEGIAPNGRGALMIDYFE